MLGKVEAEPEVDLLEIIGKGVAQSEGVGVAVTRIQKQVEGQPVPIDEVLVMLDELRCDGD